MSSGTVKETVEGTNLAGSGGGRVAFSSPSLSFGRLSDLVGTELLLSITGVSVRVILWKDREMGRGAVNLRS